MSSVASTSGATNATTTTTSRRIGTRGTRTSAAASSTAAAVSHDSSSSTRGKKRRSIQQQRPTTRSCRRRKLSTTSTSSCNSEMIDPDENDRESDNNNNSSEMMAVESMHVSSTAFQRQQKQPLVQSSSMKTDGSSTENCNPSRHCKEGDDIHQIIPVRVRRKRKLQTEQQHDNTNNADSLKDNRMCLNEMKHTTTQSDDQRIRFDNNDDAENGKKATLESQSVTESPISTIHNAKLEETSRGLVETASFLIEDNDKVNINGIDKTLASETQKEQKNEEMLIFDRLDVAQDENGDKKVSCTIESQSIVARSTEESSFSPITDDQLIKNSTIRQQQQESVCESSDEQGTISSPKIEDKVANELDCCINNNILVDDENRKSSRSSDHDIVRSIDPEHHSEEHSNLNISADQSNHLQKKALHRMRNVSSSPCELQNSHLCGGKSELDDDNEGTQDSSKSKKDTFLTPENEMEPTLDDFAFELSNRTTTTTTEPCDTNTSISKINGYRFGRIRQTASPFGNENINATDRCHQSLPLEVLNAKTHAESFELSGNLLQTEESPADTCPQAKNINSNNAFGTTDGVVSMTTAGCGQLRRVLPNGKFDLVDSIKVAIHAEASKVHRGKGANRIFSEYLERLGMYLSSTSSSRARPHASSNCSTKFSTNVDHDSSIEAFFINFLKSKKLRNMHNKLIMVLMKYSMEAQVPYEKFCSQIPHQWLKNVTEARSPVSDELIVSSEPVVNVEVDRQRAQLVNQIRYLKSSFSAESGLWAKCDTSSLLYPPPLFSVDAETSYPSKRDDRSLLPSGTVPGALAIDPLVRNITQREGVSVDEYALWLIIIATRQLTSEILQRVVTEISRSRSMSNGVVSESNNDASKHIKISTLDVAQILTKSPIYGSKCSSHTSSSRVFMDRLLNAAGRGTLPCPPEAPIGVQQAIVQLIQEASSNRSRILTTHACQVLETKSSDTSKAKTDDSSTMVYRKRRGMIDLSYPSPPNATRIGIGQLDHASTSQQTLFPASITAPCAKSEVSKQVLENAEIPKAEEDNHKGKTSPPPVSSSLSRRRVGAKDLAALRARRIASAQQEQKIHDSAHATVSTADTAVAENQDDGLLSAKDREN